MTMYISDVITICTYDGMSVVRKRRRNWKRHHVSLAVCNAALLAAHVMATDLTCTANAWSGYACVAEQT